MSSRSIARGAIAAAAGLTVSGVAGVAAADPTNLQQTEPVVWTMIGISMVGAAITFGFLIYALVKFRDPATKGRRYG